MRKPKRAKAKAKATTKAKNVTRGKAKKTAKKASARKRVMRGAGAVAAGAAGVLLVNVIPKSLSSETNQDSEPMIAVNPANTNHIVATAFTPDPLESGSAPYFFSSDGGKTWTLNTVVPGGDMTGDITVAFSGTGPALYAGILRQDSPDQSTRMAILRTADFSALTPMDVLDDRQQPDQPFAQAATVADGSAAGKQRVYVGSNDFAGGGRRPHSTSCLMRRPPTRGSRKSGSNAAPRGRRDRTALRFAPRSMRTARCMRRSTGGGCKRVTWRQYAQGERRRGRGQGRQVGDSPLPLRISRTPPMASSGSASSGM